MIKFQSDKEFVCKECFSSFTDVYKFKRNFQSTIEPANLIRKVSDFLSDSEEPISIINHHSCLSLVPESKISLVNNFVRLVDSLQESTSSSATTPLNRSSSIPLNSPTARTPTAYRKSTLLNRPIANRFNLTQSSVTITDTITPTSEDRKRKASPMLPTIAPKTMKISTTPVTSLVTASPRIRQSIRGRPSTKQLDVSTNVTVNSSDEKSGETERKLTKLEEKTLREQIQESKVSGQSYKCMHCNENCGSYKKMRSHILSYHFD